MFWVSLVMNHTVYSLCLCYSVYLCFVPIHNIVVFHIMYYMYFILYILWREMLSSEVPVSPGSRYLLKMLWTL